MKTDPRFQFTALPGMVLLPNHRFKDSTNARHFYWDKPAWAVTTEAFVANPIKYVVLFDDIIRTGDTLAAMYHAATAAGKTVLMVCTNQRHMGYPYLQQTPELKTKLQSLLEESPNLPNEANQALQQIGHSMDTLTGLQLYTLLHTDPMFTGMQGLYSRYAKVELKTPDEFLSAIKTRVSSAKESYSIPEYYMCLEYLRRHDLTPDQDTHVITHRQNPYSV